MRAEDVPGEWVAKALATYHATEGSDYDAFAAAIADVYSLMAKAERERRAKVIDCGRPGRETVLNVTNNGSGNTNNGVRWTACGRDPCCALEAAAIRALPDGEVGG